MYPSVKVHYENGQFILDEPMPVSGNVKGIFVILEEESNEKPPANRPSIGGTLKMSKERLDAYLNDIETSKDEWERNIY